MQPNERLMEMSYGISKAIFPDWIKVLFWGMPFARVRHVGDGRSRVSASMLQAPATGASPKRLKMIDVVLPKNVCLSRSLTLPPANRRNLQSMAALDLARKTPFREAEISWALLRAKPAQDRTHVQYIAKDKELRAYRENLASHGFSVRQFLIRDHEQQEVLAEYIDQVAPNRRRTRVFNTLLALVALMFLALGLLYPAALARQEIAILKLENQNLRQQALSARQALEEVQQAETLQSTFLDTLTSRRRAADDLRQVTVVLPDTAWISDLTISNDRILMAGETSQTAAALILEIAESSLRLEPSLNGAVSRTNEGRERFSLVLSKVDPQ